MKKIIAMGIICLASSAAFSQTQPNMIKDRAKDPKTKEMSAKADTMLVDKKAITDESRKKKNRKERSHKECSRMKS